MRNWLRYTLLLWMSALAFTNATAQSKNKAVSLSNKEDSFHNVLLKVIDKFDNALIQGDTNELKALLANDLTMIHSNGLKETKHALLDHISSGYLSYSSIKHLDSPKIEVWKGKKGGYWHDHFVERNIAVAGKLDGKEFNVNLKVKEHWIFDTTWKLYNRRSEKLK